MPLAVGIVKLAEADREFPHKPVSEIREATIEDGHEPGMRNSDWPFDDGETADAEPAPEADR